MISNHEIEDGISSSLSFKIAVPKGEPVTYAIQDAAETVIKSLYLYEFDSNKKLLAAPVDIKSELTSIVDGYSYQKAIDPTKKEIYYFYLVANEAPNELMVIGKTIDELKAISASKSLITKTSCSSLINNDAFPMTGIATKNGSELIPLTNDGVPLNVNLTRVVARLDIKNNMEGLVITSVKLVKTNDKSHLFLSQVEEQITVPAAVNKVDEILPFAAMPLPAFDKGQEMKKAFYLYEGNQPNKDEAVHVEVAGKLGGIDVLYSIPFWKGDKENEVGEEVAIKRNHLYHLILGDGSETIPDVHADAAFTLTDKAWTEQTEAQGFHIITANYTPAVGTDFDVKSHELIIDNAAYTGLSFDFSTLFSAHSKFLVSDTPAWITASVVGNKVTLNVIANTALNAVSREAKIEVTSDADSFTIFSILVKQSK